MRRGRESAGLVAVAACLVAAACSSPDDASGERPSTPTSSQVADEPGLSLVVLGDSIPHPSSCRGCSIFPDQVAAALGEDRGEEVEVLNRSKVISDPRPSSITDILARVRSGEEVREALTGATMVLVVAGQNDLAYGLVDDPCGVAPSFPAVRWTDLTDACIDMTLDTYEEGLDGLLTEIDSLGGERPPIVRVVSSINTALGDVVDPTWNSPQAVEPTTYNVSRMVEIQKAVAARHGAACVDLYHLMNGPKGNRSAQRFLSPVDATHLNQKGQDFVADAIIDVGFG